MLNINEAHVFYNEGAKLELKKTDIFELKYKLNKRDYAGLVIPLNPSETGLGENFAVEFEIRGDTRKCKFECKLASNDSVWWVVKTDFQITENWQSYTHKRRHFVYAWGPNQEFLTVAKQLELVITADEECEGEFEIKNIKLTPVELAKTDQENVQLNVSSGNADFLFNLKPWVADHNENQNIEINFKTAVELGGLIINWDIYSKCDFNLKIKDAKDNIKLVEAVSDFRGGSSFHYLPDCDASAITIEISQAKNCIINSIEFKGASFSASWNAFLSNIALRKTRGLFPRYFYKEQSYWTVVAEDASFDKALINEEGMLELGYEQPSIDPFIRINNTLFTWAESIQTQKLRDKFIPFVERVYKDFTLKITAWMQDEKVFGEYEITNTSEKDLNGALILSIRPYQVNPPWQFLNTTGGFTPINTIKINNKEAVVNENKKIFSFKRADNFYATSKDSLGNTDFDSAFSDKGTCSASFEYNFEIKPGESKKWFIGTDEREPISSYSAAVEKWNEKFKNLNFSVLEETVRAQLLYIFSNRSGPAIQPGTRCYRRTWIRDATMTSSALLHFGFFKEVKEFIEWFAPYVDASTGWAVPSVVDRNSVDNTPEHDSHGEFLFLVSEYYRHTKNKTFIKKLFPKLLNVAKHIKELTDQTANQAPHIRGLLPKSISHEGYAANPAYSYWDNIWAIKGLQGLSYVANDLQNHAVECEEFCNKFTNVVLNSIDASMQYHNIDFIPGAADLGDFDATSTTIGVAPCAILLKERKEALKITFERYWKLFCERENNFIGAYTPYEIRTVGTFIRLGEIEKAWRALDFFLKDRRPQGWLHWAEVVFANEREPGFVGDEPHGWVASDFLRAAKSIVIYELANEYYIGAGITKEMWRKGVNCWLHTPDGVIKVKSSKNQISIKGRNGLEVWLMQNNEFSKITLPYKLVIL